MLEKLKGRINMDQLKISKDRLKLVNEEIIPKFLVLLKELENGASNHMAEAKRAAYWSDGIDYAKDCYVDARYEEAAFHIFEGVVSNISKTERYIKGKIDELEQSEAIRSNQCMDCGKILNADVIQECESCHRHVCKTCLSKCENCGKNVCLMCTLFKYSGHVRCVECYEDIISDHVMWVEDEWIDDYHRYY